MWRRLPTYFPNIRLTMLPLSPEAREQLVTTGWMREVAFKTEPRVNKAEIKAYLEAVHGMAVERVSTINYLGKKKRVIDDRGRVTYKRLSDWKKAYVLFVPPDDVRAAWEQQQQQQRSQQLEQRASSSDDVAHTP